MSTPTVDDYAAAVADLHRAAAEFDRLTSEALRPDPDRGARATRLLCALAGRPDLSAATNPADEARAGTAPLVRLLTRLVGDLGVLPARLDSHRQAAIRELVEATAIRELVG